MAGLADAAETGSASVRAAAPPASIVSDRRIFSFLVALMDLRAAGGLLAVRCGLAGMWIPGSQAAGPRTTHSRPHDSPHKRLGRKPALGDGDCQISGGPVCQRGMGVGS